MVSASNGGMEDIGGRRMEIVGAGAGRRDGEYRGGRTENGMAGGRDANGAKDGAEDGVRQSGDGA